ncbi:amino acid ABC transporter permease [Paraburkholderia sp.]|uniref:amino acid ABC transporter permease n=1 Tax=Paraburkholderia sp. TaxID=1926495 RepID=UPI003C7CA433
MLGFLRVIPPLLVIFWLYFLIPILLGADVPQTATAIAALASLSSAYVASSTRAGILSITSGQWQAGLSIGLTRVQTLRWVVLPEAVRLVLPSFVNQFIALVKDTSLAYVIGVSELTYMASQVNNRTLMYPADIFLFVALVYFVFCLSLSVGAEALMRRFSNGGARTDKVPESILERWARRESWHCSYDAFDRLVVLLGHVVQILRLVGRVTNRHSCSNSA